MDKGHITMTERSVGAFHRLKGEGECEEDKADGEKSQKKNPKQGKGTGFKATHRRLRGTALRSMKKHQNPDGSNGNLVICQQGRMLIECIVVVNVKKKAREKRFNVAEFILQTYDGWRLLYKRSWRYSKPCLNNAIISFHKLLLFPIPWTS